ncbi:MAG TPA: hypothetical protein VNO52_09050, partial [Methylomirabilota bacterium]|nr:hypothetical protein [Methylomirabilota bacterium]
MMQLLSQKRPPSSMLGLSLDGSRLTGVLLRRSNGSLLVQKTLHASLALNPLNGDPELVGREIRNNLDQAGLRERRCVLGVPLSWALTLQVAVPELPEADLASFLEIEAERGFPYAPEALALASSLCRPEAGERLATLVAVPRNHLLQMEAVMKAAQLRPVSFSFGLPALADPARDSATGLIALTLGETAVELQVNCHGGVAALRSIEEAVHWEGAHKVLIASVVIREIRVTLGQLSDAYRKTVRKVRLYGNGEAAAELARDLAAAVGRLGLEFEHITAYVGDEFRSRPPAGTTVSPTFSLAARHLTGLGSPFEFLPPKVSPLRRLTARISSRKLGWIGAPAAAVVLIAGVAILAQQ